MPGNMFFFKGKINQTEIHRPIYIKGKENLNG